jgi:hypothetical protein
MSDSINTTTVERLATEKPKSFRIPVYSGIFEHYQEIGDAVWLLMFYVDRTTIEKPSENGDGTKVGYVLGGAPIHDADIAKVFGCHKKTISRWRKILLRKPYIEQTRTPYGRTTRVSNSKKFADRKNDGRDKNVPPQPPALLLGTQTAPGGTRLDRPGTELDRGGTQPGESKKTLQYGSEQSKTKTQNSSGLQDQIVSVYQEKFGGRKLKLWPADLKHLKELEAEHDSKTILGAYALYLDDFETEEGKAAFARKANYPFGFFFQQFDDIAKELDRRKREEIECAIESDLFDDRFEPSQMREVILTKGGRTQTCRRSVAEDWEKNGYAKIVENTHRIPAAVVDVIYARQRYRMDPAKAERYEKTGMIRIVPNSLRK